MTVVLLPPHVDISAEMLASTLRTACAAGAVTVDATAVTRVDAAGLQLLCAAAKALQARGESLCWRTPSRVVVDGARILGLATTLGLDLANTEEH